jgi:sensor c-di-GMP phosphodiesterase-like protein
VKFHPVLALAYLAGLVAIAAPITLALSYTDHLTLREQENVADQLAQQTLRRNELITGQVYQAIRQMEEARVGPPCSATSHKLMASTTLRYYEVQAVAYVRDKRIVCSSLGMDGTDVGVPDYVTRTGSEVRLNRKLVADEPSIFRITTSASGYSAIVHAELVFDALQRQDEVALGQISTVNFQPITRQGIWRPEWAQRLGEAKQVSFFDGDYVVALRRSERYTYFAYAALPAHRLQTAWKNQAMLVVPLGILAGLMLAASVYFITRQQIGLRGQLRSALRRDKELYLVYQPVVDMASGHWVGAEALIRWRRPNGESVSPSVFVPMAEHTQLMGQLTRKVITMAARDAADLLKARADFVLSINFAATDLYDAGLAEHLARTMREHNLQAKSLVIEATERTFIDAEQSRTAIQRLRAQGHRVAIDDFGTGYSSLSYLTRLEVDTIKIDRSFVETIGTGAVTSHVVSHIIEMAKSLQLRMVAEGVETEAQATYLREHGVQLAQGWLYAQAMRIEELVQELDARQA